VRDSPSFCIKESIFTCCDFFPQIMTLRHTLFQLSLAHSAGTVSLGLDGFGQTGLCLAWLYLQCLWCLKNTIQQSTSF